MSLLWRRQTLTPSDPDSQEEHLEKTSPHFCVSGSGRLQGLNVSWCSEASSVPVSHCNLHLQTVILHLPVPLLYCIIPSKGNRMMQYIAVCNTNCVFPLSELSTGPEVCVCVWVCSWVLGCGAVCDGGGGGWIINAVWSLDPTCSDYWAE